MGGQMGQMGMGMPRQQIRQGTSHMVPIVVSAGLAVGVFCGLLFGLGTKRDVLEVSKGGTGAKQSEESLVQSAQVSTGKPIKGTPGAGTPVGAATGSAPPAVGSAGSAAPATGSDATAAAGSDAAPHVGKLTVDVEPETAAAAAKILVDGKQITGKVAEIAFDAGVTKRPIKVVVKLPNARDIERTVDVEADADASIQFDLKGVKVAPAPSDDTGKTAGGNTTGGTSAATGGNKDGASSGGNKDGASSGGNKDGGSSGGNKDGGNKAGGNKGKGKGKGSSGLIDI
jgi:hypothetical protein